MIKKIRRKDTRVRTEYIWINAPEMRPFLGSSQEGIVADIYLATYARGDDLVLLDKEDNPLTISRVAADLSMDVEALNAHISDSELITLETNGCLYASPDWIACGEPWEDSVRILRLYREEVRSLITRNYRENFVPLCHLLQLIPMANLHFGIICFNVFESNYSSIFAFDAGKICDYLDIPDECFSSLIESICSLTFLRDGDVYPAAKWIDYSGLYSRGAYGISTYLVYGGYQDISPMSIGGIYERRVGRENIVHLADLDECIL